MNIVLLTYNILAPLGVPEQLTVISASHEVAKRVCKRRQNMARDWTTLPVYHIQFPIGFGAACLAGSLWLSYLCWTQ